MPFNNTCVKLAPPPHSVPTLFLHVSRLASAGDALLLAAHAGARLRLAALWQAAAGQHRKCR